MMIKTPVSYRTKKTSLNSLLPLNSPLALRVSILLISTFTFLYGCNDTAQPTKVTDSTSDMMTSQAGEQVAGEQVAGEQVAGEQVAGEQVAGEQVAGEQVIETTVCESPRSQDDALVTLSFPYAEMIGEEGQSIQVYRFENEQLLPWGERLELGAKTSALTFSKDGWWLLALSERGKLTSIDLRGELPTIVSSIDLVLGDYSIIQPADEARKFDVINSNSDEFSGLYSLRLNCDGTFELADSYFYLRLIQGFQRAQSVEKQAFVFGGQALFEPIDLIDLRWMSASEQDGYDEWSELAHLDVYEDYIDAINLGVSPQDDWLTVVNGSPFTEEGGQVRFIEIQQDPPQLNERFLFEGYTDVRGAWFLEGGNTVMITQLEVNAVQFFVKNQNEWTVGQRVEGIGLANQSAFLATHSEENRVYALIPSVSPSGGGSGVSLLNILDGESVMSLPTISLGEGFINIPKAIAAWPLIEN